MTENAALLRKTVITFLKRTNLIEYKFDELLLLAQEIKRMLIVSLNTAQGNT